MSFRERILGLVPLSVGKYGDRVKGKRRGHDVTGKRLDCHHVPHAYTTNIPLNEGTAVAIPKDTHGWLHRVRDQYRIKETLYDQVENDYDFIRDQLKRRGYSDELIDESLKLTHLSNRQLSYRNPYTGQTMVVDIYDPKNNVKREISL